MTITNPLTIPSHIPERVIQASGLRDALKALEALQDLVEKSALMEEWETLSEALNAAAFYQDFSQKLTKDLIQGFPA